jgi:hypothetical protein
MHKFSDYVLSEGRRPTKRITIECNDPDNSLVNLLKYIQQNGNGGHSFSIVVDPGDKGFATANGRTGGEKKFFFDGDGSDHIGSVSEEQLVAEDLTVDKDTIEKAAENVHDRWVDNQEKKGHKSHKSPDGKEEYMVDYDDLSEPAKQLDRDAVHAVIDALKDTD